MGALVQPPVKAKVDNIGRSTDTRYYWNLTRHIVRYNHQDGGNGHSLPNGIHTVNERMFGSSSEFGLQVLISLADIPANNVVEMIRFFCTLILNADESREI